MRLLQVRLAGERWFATGYAPKNLKRSFFFRQMERVDDDILELAAELQFDQLFEGDDDMYTHFSGDVSLEEIIDFNIQITDLNVVEEHVHDDLSNVDWEKVDWEHVAANWQQDELELLSTNKSILDDDQTQTNKRRRLNELERLNKYSWERHPLKVKGKRERYKYVHADGSTVTSLRAALEKCGK
tara:strand:+ start:990 stop:1544 length:555 start_codon:yes stop_codon:yes gene_type:complete